MGTDQRYMALYTGINQLPTAAVSRLQAHIQADLPLVTDSVHYEPETQTWCPLAIALDVPHLIPMPLDEGHSREELEIRVLSLIDRIGQQAVKNFTTNPMHGIPGEFYRANRYRDLACVVARVLEERN